LLKDRYFNSFFTTKRKGLRQLEKLDKLNRELTKKEAAKDALEVQKKKERSRTFVYDPWNSAQDTKFN